jgi:hypothetical protein
MSLAFANEQVGPPPVKLAVMVPVPVALGPEKVTVGETIEDAVAELLPAFASAVVEATLAVLTMEVPAAAETSTAVVSVKLAVAPAASVASEQLTLPLALTAGVVHVKAGPAVCASETNAVPAGSASESATAWAAFALAFATVMSYVSVLPAVTVAGAVLVSERSVFADTVVLAVDALLALAGSAVAEPRVAVFDRTAPSAVAAGTATARSKLAVAPAASVAIVQVTVPPEPTAGVVQLKVGPLDCDSETNVAPAGIESLSATDCASLGPALASVIE